MHIVLATGASGLAWTGSRYSSQPGPEPLRAMRAPLKDELDPPECHLSYQAGFRTVAGIAIQLPDVGELAFAVTCADDAPLTELDLRYARGALVEVRTDPAVPCVEERAREVLSAVADLRLGDPKMPGTLPTRLEWRWVGRALSAV